MFHNYICKRNTLLYYMHRNVFPCYFYQPSGKSIIYDFILGLKNHEAIYEKIKAAEIPTADAVKPPLNIPINPS